VTAGFDGSRELPESVYDELWRILEAEAERLERDSAARKAGT
jgi:hypothetical protein